MHAVAAQLLFLLTIGWWQGACLQSRPDQVIWFPIDNYDNGYESSLGEVFITKPPVDDPYARRREGERAYRGYGSSFESRRRDRSVMSGWSGFGSPAENWAEKDEREYANLVGIFGSHQGGDRRTNLLDLWAGHEAEAKRETDDAVVFPGRTNGGRVSREEEECRKGCPLTWQYNPVCGSDMENYHNMGHLNCEKMCGKSVTFAHYGVCGRGLPLIFRPKPRRPSVTLPPTQVDSFDW